MCSVSAVMDIYADRWRDWQTQPFIPNPIDPTFPIKTGPTQAEFDALRREVAEMREIVKKAMEFDKRTGQPDCETAEKVEKVRKIAEMVGINLDDILPRSA